MKLEAKKLSFFYGENQILNNYSFSLQSGERIGLSGVSGSGKTTLCRLLAGYQLPQEGEILLDGKPLQTYKGYCPVQLIGQHPEQMVNPRLRLRDIVIEGGPVAPELAEALALESAWLDRFPGELSGGELQRFCIARALKPGTRFLLADEISTMLDWLTQSQLWNFLLEETKRRGIGLLVVSHSPSLLERVCERTIEFP